MTLLVSKGKLFLTRYQQWYAGKLCYFLISLILGFLGSYQSPVFFLPLFWWFILFLKDKQFFLSGLLVICCFFGIFQGTSLTKKVQLAETLTETKLQGTLLLKGSDYQVYDNYLKGTGYLLPKKEKVLVIIPKLINPVENTNRLTLQFSGKQEPLELASNTFNFSERDYYPQQGIYQKITIEKYTLKSLEKSPKDFFRNLKTYFAEKISLLFPEKLGSFYLGSLLRKKDAIFYQQEQVYQRSGLWQLFFFSGLQYYFLLEMLRQLLLRIGVTKGKTAVIQSFVGFLGLLFFQFPFIFCRSFLFSLMRYLPKKWFSALDKWCLVVCFLQFIFPYQLFTFSGQLIYSVTFFFYCPLSKNDFFKKIGLPLLIAPIFWWHFFQWTPLIFLLGWGLRKYFGLFFKGSLLLFSLLLLLPKSSLMALEKGYELFFASLSQISSLNLHWVVGRPPLLLLLGYYLFWLLFFYFSLDQKGKGLKILFISSFFLLGFWSFLNPIGEVTFVNVGQGDGILLKAPFKKEVYLIDTGGRLPFGENSGASNAKKTLIPYLKGRGIKKINGIFITHGDYDHMGDLAEVASEFPIGTIYLQKNSLEKDLMKETIKKVQGLPNGKKIQWHFLKQGESFSLGKNQLYFLGPEQGEGSNDDSLQLFLPTKEETFLFTGDVEENGETKLLKAYPNLTCSVLKVPHHGSKTSSTEKLLDQLKPKEAIISAGKKNRYQHPHPEVVTRLKNRRIKIKTTFEAGEITYLLYP